MNDKVKEVLAEVFDMKSSEITVGLTKDDIDTWDSLRQMDLVTSLEKEFDIRLEMMEIVSLDSVAKTVEILKSKGVDVGD
ncbi:acyl carrier protein [Sulfurimonas sp.]|uniref:acyl carrier protein n=1 Tax=Sulfurimonas sp. TaxID=2022749 RepID=UPI0019F07DA0|nr:acyl carrier protein [Sulfurimonas sp.]MBE0515247.1 acyl carrier protein [Sulfurimonas sp.]